MQPRKLEGFTYTQPAVNPNTVFARILQQKEQERLAQEAQKAKGKRGSGNQSWLSSLISELGGAGGAIGGAAAGAAAGSVVPGIGNILGGIAGGVLGGFAGGTGGRLVENQVRDNEMRLGDALKEGAVSGAFGAIGPAWQGARGLQTLGKASGGGFKAGLQALSNVSDDAARASLGKALSMGGKKAAQGALSQSDDLVGSLARIQGAKGAPVGTVELSGRTFKANAMGLGQGAKAPGMSAIDAKQSDDLIKVIQDGFKIRANTPEKVERLLSPKLEQAGKELAKIYQGAGKVSSKQVSSVADDILRQVVDDPSINLTKASKKALERQLALLKKSGTVDDVWKFQKQMGNSINFGKNVESKLVDREAVARVARENIKKFLEKQAPGTAKLNSLYSNGQQAKKLLVHASKQADKTGAVARVMTSQPVRRGEAYIGRAGEALGGGIRGVGDVTPQLAKRLAAGTAVRGVANNALGFGGQPVQQTEPMQEQALTVDDILSMSGQSGGAMPQQQSDNPFAPENAQSAIAQILQQGGDFGDIKDYLSIVEAVSGLSGSGGGGESELNVTKPTSEKYAQAVAGRQSLNQLEQLLESDPGVLQRSRAPGRGVNILGIGSNIRNATSTGEFDALAFSTVDNALRIVTGAAAPDSEIRRYINQYIPQPGDDEATTRAKLDALKRQFDSILNLAQPGSASGSDLSAILGGL